ncbi:MAG TPA: DUF4232 domain-containing protein [Streptosporangiaceae bacterium]
MSLTSRTGRRLAVGLGLATAAVLLPAAALASPAAPVASGHAAAQAVPACRASQTRVWYGLPADNATGHAFFQLQISNIGHSTCTFFGYPGVSALNSHGNQVGRAASHYGRRLSVTLKPGGTTHMVLVVTNAFLVCSHPVQATDLRVFPPGQTHSQNVPLATGQCPGKSVLAVDSVHPGTGIPGFTTR